MVEPMVEPSAPKVRVLILAGGVGSRFWPVSTPARPKQLLPLGSSRPLIVDTVERAERIAGRDHLRILSGGPVARAIQEETGLPDSAMHFEPQAKGTCPVLAWAAWVAEQEAPGTVLISLHADHVIEPEGAFVQLMLDAARLADEEDVLLTVAVPPTRAEPGYGHIEPGPELARVGTAQGLTVRSFHEKPDPETAQRYVDEGYLWNSGIFLWRADRFLEEVRAHEPGVAAALSHLETGDVDGFFEACPNVTVDDAVLERSDRVATVRATFQWDDVGSWEALTRTQPRDDADNVAVGDTHMIDASGNVVFAESGSVVLWGVDDLVVVRSGDITFVGPREASPDLKKLLGQLPSRLTNPGSAS